MELAFGNSKQRNWIDFSKTSISGAGNFQTGNDAYVSSVEDRQDIHAVHTSRGTREINSFTFAKDPIWLCVIWWSAASEVKKGKLFILDERIWSEDLNLGVDCTQSFYGFVLLAEAAQSFNVEGGGKNKKFSSRSVNSQLYLLSTPP